MRFVKGSLLFLLIVVVILAVVLGGGYLYLTRRAFPQTDGTVRFPGLARPHHHRPRQSGIPHIYAANTHDLFMAQGYVQAQDRFWQMELFRPGIAGNTSQLQPSIGNLEADKFVRTLGGGAPPPIMPYGRRSQGDIAGLADGVNAYRDSHASSLPSVFFIVGAFGSKGTNFQPQPWDPIDSLQTAKYMAWDLSGNADNEMFHVKLMQKFGEANYPAVVNALQPPYDYKNMPIIVPEGIVWKNVPAQLSLFDKLDAAFGKRDRGLGSNNWVNGTAPPGSHWQTIRTGHTVPALWY
jgi:penicillin amidase